MQCAARMMKAVSFNTCVATSATSAFPTLHEIAANRKGLAKVVLKKGKVQLFKDGNPMVYSGAVDRIIGRPPPKTGDVVVVADGSEKPIGWGVYNSVSMYCVRLMQLEQEVTRYPVCALNMEKLIEMRISAATELRHQLGLPSADTNAYRLVNSEGDRLSGLIVDVFGDVAVVASSAAWVERHRAVIELYIRQNSGIRYVKWRPTIDVLKEEGVEHPELSTDLECPEEVEVKENGILFKVSMDGQKTGFYADQRENRHFVSLISKDKTVLDLCCYSGGFSLNAARSGATNITGIDSSLPAVELARANAVLNKLDTENLSFLKEDASDFMKVAISREDLWDLVILDPPKLAPRKKDLRKAYGMYRNLNSLAMKITKKGGLLMTCSCSGAITQSGTFHRILQDSAASVDRKITILRQSGAASDHPLDPAYPEGSYLTNTLVRVL